MLKKNKWSAIISSFVILLPAILGLIFWDHLPEQMVTHWGPDGTPDGIMGKVAAVAVLPAILLAVHWLCLLITAWDWKKNPQGRKVEKLIFWLMPVVSLFTGGVMYGAAMGYGLKIFDFVFLFLGIMFAVIGNYMPKCKQNFTMGIKIKWTLSSEENWRATHRFAGKLWVAGGILLMLCVFLPEKAAIAVMIGSIFVMTLPPFIYSWRYYKKQQKEGTAGECPAKWQEISRKAKIISAVALVPVLILVAVLMFVGKLTVEFGETGFTVDASFSKASYIEYSSVESVELRPAGEVGTRTFGLGSLKLLTGSFHNEEFGDYTRYSYTNSDFELVLKVSGKIFVIGFREEAEARQTYDTLLDKING